MALRHFSPGHTSHCASSVTHSCRTFRFRSFICENFFFKHDEMKKRSVLVLPEISLRPVYSLLRMVLEPPMWSSTKIFFVTKVFFKNLIAKKFSTRISILSLSPRPSFFSRTASRLKILVLRFKTLPDVFYSPRKIARTGYRTCCDREWKKVRYDHNSRPVYASAYT